MDPYLEGSGLWPDFHAAFITYWRDELAERLPENYEVRIDERVEVVARQLSGEEVKRIRPDLAIERKGESKRESRASPIATLEPVTIPLITTTEEIRQTWIEVYHRPGHDLVAVLELLSPVNKSGPGSNLYLSKRNALIRQPVHLIELDLLVGGNRLPFSAPLPSGDYFAMVARGDHRPDVEVYAWTVRQPLPTIPIPLKAPDPDVPADLEKLFSLAYERGRYGRSLDYAVPPGLPLDPAEAEWVIERGRLAGQQARPDR